jgi:outer membrane protein OmpA-like peptidoglycan-associated protein
MVERVDTFFVQMLSNVCPVPRFIAIVISAAMASVMGGCAHEVPPRPVPQLERQPELPPWYPEEPWNSKGAQSRVFFEGKILFDTDKSSLRPEGEKVLGQLLEWLQKNPDISRVRLEGHTDSRASEEYNQGLSERRAIAAADWLVDHGLDNDRIIATAFGETRPIAPNDTAAGMQENRRAAFRPAEVAGRRFRGEDPAGGGLVLIVLSKEEREAAKKQGEVPKDERPPFKPEGTIFKEIPAEEQKQPDLLDEAAQQDAAKQPDAPKAAHPDASD